MLKKKTMIRKEKQKIKEGMKKIQFKRMFNL
jgi:hypothetical protein